jgi:transcriptional regulator with XRE-family HTH domain
MRMNKGNYKNTLGGRIKKSRDEHGWSQEELGFKIGVNNKSVISSYENDKRVPSIPVLQALRRVLDTSMDYLINGTETSELNADPLISEAVQELRKLKTEKSRKAALEHIRIVVMME